MGVVTTALAWLGGPKPSELGEGITGDVALAAQVRAAAGDPAGYRGLAVALIEDGTVRYAGVGDDRGGVALDEHTPFEIGSIGKALTGMLLADLIEDGTVHADEPLGELLPDVEFQDPAMARVTLAELASHRSGLASVRVTGAGQALGMTLRDVRGADPYAGQDTDWLMSTIASARPGEGRETVDYSNYGFAVLGQALAVRAGIPYPELLRQRILAPLGLEATTFHLDGAELPAGHASGQGANGWAADPWQASGYVPAGIGIWSTAEDMAALVSAMLAGTAPGVDAATARFDAGTGSRVGYGWFTNRVEGHEITWHNGGTGGFRSYVGFDPATGRGVVVLGNTDRWVEAIGERLLTGEGPGGGSGAGAGPVPIAVTLLLSLGAGLALLWQVTRGATGRLQLVTNGVLAVALLVWVYAIGAWGSVPTLVWAAGVGLVAGAAVLAARRWRGLPLHAGRIRWLSWSGPPLAAVVAGAVIAWLYA